MHGDPLIVPVVGISSVAQLDDALGAVDVPREVVAALAEAVEAVEAIA
jgi:aryl-alcohol dehydrogenase-like predicted oxidoreductase